MTRAQNLKRILLDGVWHQNTGLVVLLGLCPLLAVTGTVNRKTTRLTATSAFMIRDQRRRAARNLATSSRRSLWALKKKERRGANESTSSPRDRADST